MSATPLTSLQRKPQDRGAALAQLEKILQHPAFRSSERSTKFLRYVVEHQLGEDHNDEPLKERTIGVAVFGLNPAYDTSQNTVVRSAAVEVRKRLVLYYLDPEHAGEFQITLPAGSYVPQMLFPDDMGPEGDKAHEQPHQEKEPKSGTQFGVIPQLPTQRRLRPQEFAIPALIALLAVGIGALGASLILKQSSPSAVLDNAELQSLSSFWSPVLNAKPYEPVILICFGQLEEPVENQQVAPLGDTFATADVARLLDGEGVKYRINVANLVTADQLQATTVILIGGMENQWTSATIERLRFHFASQNGTL